MFAYKVEALSYQPVDFQKLSRNQNGYRILNVKLRSTVLHDGRIGEEYFLLLIVALLHLEGPLFIHLLSLSLLLFVLLHGEDVIQ
jgi:hypothetical protein